MASDEKIMEGGGEGTSHDTPQAITITIMAPSALETTTIDSALVASVEAQDARQASDSLLVVPTEGDGSTISVTHGAKNLLQTVTETHMGSEDLPVISNINSSEDTTEESTTIQFVNKSEKLDDLECEEGDNLLGCHCLICNEELESEQFPVFKSVTTTSQRKVSVFLGILVGQKLTSRKAHSSIICEKCFNLLNKLDLLEVQIRQTKDEIVHKYQETVAAYGGRARRKKPAAAKKSDYVFPKIEPEDEDQQALALEMDETFEPLADDLIEEEQDRREDRDSQDEEWEPEFKRARIKREPSNADPSGAPKRKRGRPRKDASKPKRTHKVTLVDSGGEKISSKCSVTGSNETDERQNVPSLRKRPKMTSDNKLPMSSQEPQEGLACDRTDSTSVETHYIPSTLKVDFESLCCSCGVQSSSAEKYVDHLLTHRSKIFKCPKCLCAYSLSSYLARHQHIVHSGDEQSTTNTANPTERDELCSREGNYCKYCDESVSENIVDHLKIHLYGENECPVCTTAFYTPQSIETHIQKHHPQSLQQFKIFEHSQKERQGRSGDTTHHLELCDICGKVLTSSSRLAQHRYSEHPEHYPWPCGDCNLAFPSSGDRDQHVCHKKKIRRTTKQTDCDASSTKNKSKTSPKLSKGQGNRDKCTDESVNCPVCSVVLVSRKAFRDHMRSHKRNGFKCEHCGKIVKSKANLRTHLSTIHTHGEIHQCEKCPQIFFSTGRLSYHLRRHHTDRDTYRNLCHLCGKSYPYPSELRLHLRSHRNERPYACDQCSKTFMKKGDLTYHKRSHTGERPHKCPHCDARFPRPNTLMNHIRQQHQEGVRVSTADATTTTTSSKTVSLTRSATTTTPPTCVTTPTAVMVLSPNYKSSHRVGRQQRQTVDTIIAVDDECDDQGTGPQDERTMIPVMSEGHLVEAVVEGQMTEVQYVQVAAGQTVQAHMVEGMGYDESECGPYQIVHLQILE